MFFFFFQDPEGNLLDEVARTYRVGPRLKRIENVLSRKARLDPSKVFRSHLEEEGDFVEQPDIGHREVLDLLMGGLSALHVGGLNATARNQMTEVGVERLERLLENNLISAWYERHYPYAPPILVRDNLQGKLPGTYMDPWVEELGRDEFGEQYRRFLHLDQRFIADSVIGDFIMLLDDFYVRGEHISDLHWALQNTDRLARWLKRKSRLRLVEAMQSFFEFAEDLDAYLSGLDNLPVLRCNVWLHFAYWFGSGGERMVEVAAWLEEAAVNANREAPASDLLDLQGSLRRLRDPNHYPFSALKSLRPELRNWLRNSGVGTRLKAGS